MLSLDNDDSDAFQSLRDGKGKSSGRSECRTQLISSINNNVPLCSKICQILESGRKSGYYRSEIDGLLAELTASR